MKVVKYNVTIQRINKRGQKYWSKETWTRYIEETDTGINHNFDYEATKQKSRISMQVCKLNYGLHKMTIEKLTYIEKIISFIEWYDTRKQYEVDYDSLTLNVFKYKPKI